MDSNAAAGVEASVMGRPMTRQSAPAAIASRGVSDRFWSPSAFPLGRIPRHSNKNSSPQICRSWLASWGEHTALPSPNSWNNSASVTGGAFRETEEITSNPRLTTLIMAVRRFYQRSKRAWRDSNPRPFGPEPNALSTAPHALLLHPSRESATISLSLPSPNCK
jgi:hypothetical protein